MALLYFDGFDHIGTSTAIIATKWGSVVGLPGGTATNVRTGTQALWLNSSGQALVTKVLPASGGFVVGLALFSGSAWNAAQDIIQIREGSTVHLALGSDGTSTQKLVVRRGSTILATGTTVLTLNSYYYIEFKGTIHDTTGSYEVRIDGVSEAALTASGVDTRNAGTTGQWDRVFLSPPGGGNYYVDDLYVCDQSGTSRNDFLGPVRVETLYPQTDAVAAGSNAGLTPSTGTDHGALVDENPPNTTDYNSSPTVGLKDTYNYPPLSLTGTILGIQTNLYAAKSDTALRQVCPVIRSGGVDYDGANVSLLTTFAYFSQVWAKNPNPDGSADWTSADIATLQAGMKVTA
jgi:hypothetical protein